MSSSVSRELRTELEPELLRGVPLDVVLSSWARHFRPPDPGMFQVDHANYDLSKQLDYYDEFLSHDWETSRWYKLCTMMMIYNSRAAFWCTCFASIAVGILSAMKMIPNELWTQLSVLAVYPFVLCFWQRIRSIFARPMMVFLDKLCIAQHDEELKQKGIFGLAGFLDHSRQLTIFWSHRYFSRLWCTYEVGTFLRDKKQKPILVIPVKLAVIFSVLSLAELLIMGGYFASASITLETESTENEFQQLISFYLFFSIFYAPALPVLFFLGIGMMSDLTDLPRQLREFRVQDAKCFCCSNQHRHPDTGETLPCDRELMFHTLKKWFGKEEDLHDEHLETFNQLVHKDLAPQVLQSVASDVLPFSYSMYMVVVSCFPGLCSLIPRLVEGPPDTSGAILQHTIWVCREIMAWIFPGVVVLYALRLSTRFWLIAVRLSPKGSPDLRHRLFYSLLMPIPMSCMLASQWFSFQVALSQSEHDSLLPAIPFLAWVLLLYFFWTWGTPVATKTPTELGSNVATSVVVQQVTLLKEEVLATESVDPIILETDEGDTVSTFST